MQWVNRIAIAVFGLTLLSGGTRQDLHPQQLELVVFETRYCGPCRDFRFDTIKPYFQSNRGADIPMHVIDYDYLGTAGRALSKPIETLPTTVVMDHGREIGRIVGNPTHDTFIMKVDEFVATSG